MYWVPLWWFVKSTHRCPTPFSFVYCYVINHRGRYPFLPTCNRVYCIHVPGHDPLIFSFLSFSVLIGWEFYGPNYLRCYLPVRWAGSVGAGIARWLEHRTRDWKVSGSNPCWNGGRIFFSRVDFLCWLLFRYPFHPRVTTVARKKSRSFCQKVQVAGYS